MSNRDPLAGVYKKLSAHRPQTSLEVQAVARVGKDFKVIAVASNLEGDIETAVTAAIAEATGGAGRVIPGSVRQSGRLVAAFVRPNPVSKPIDNTFTMVTASQAQGPDGKLWSIVNVGGAKRVVLESSDDLNDIFQRRMALRTVHANPVEGRSLVVASLGNGDVVRYVDEAEVAGWGIAFHTTAGLTVLGPDLLPRNVARDAVVVNVPRQRLPAEVAKCIGQFEEKSKLSPDKMQTIVAYLRKAGVLNDAMQERLQKLAATAA